MYISPTPLTNRLSNQASMKTSQTGIGPKIACGPVSHTLGLEHHAKACLELHQAVTMGAFPVQPRNEYAVIAQMRKKDRFQFNGRPPKYIHPTRHLLWMRPWL